MGQAGSGHCLWLLPEKPGGDRRLNFCKVIALLTLPIPLLVLLYTSLSHLPAFYSGFHLRFLIISLFLQQPLCKVTYTEQQHTPLEKKERNVPVSLETTSRAFPWRTLKSPFFWHMHFL